MQSNAFPLRRRLLPVASLALALAAAPGAARLVDAVHNYDGQLGTALPGKLSQTGLYANIAAKPRAVTEGIHAFDVNTALWSDGTHKERFVTVPPGTKVTPTDTDKYVFPDKSVLVKNFAIDTVDGDARTRILIETRFLVFRAAAGGGQWHGFTYAWKRDQSDADLVSRADGDNVVHLQSKGGKAYGMRWRYPSSGDCDKCHTSSGRGTLGFITPQLNRPSRTNASVNQLQDLVAKLVLASNPLAANPNAVKWAGVTDAAAPLELRGRSYLAANCSHCHGNNQAPGVTHIFDYLNPRMKFKADSNDLFAAGPYVGKPGPSMEFPQLLYPGHPDSSEIIRRMLVRGTFEEANGEQMPLLATYVPDSSALRMLADWACVMGGKAPGTCKLPDVPQPGPVSVRPSAHAARAADGLAYTLRRTASGWRLDLAGASPDDVRLVDPAGRSIPLRRGVHGGLYLAEGLRPGAYFLKAGARSIRIAVGE